MKKVMLLDFEFPSALYLHPSYLKFLTHLYHCCLKSPLPKIDYMVLVQLLTGKGAKCVPDISLNSIPAGVFLLWAFRKSLSGGEKALAESLSVKESKICEIFSSVSAVCQLVLVPE
jgi:hypothetical protein